MKLSLRVDGADRVHVVESRGRGRHVRHYNFSAEEAVAFIRRFTERECGKFKSLDERHVERAGGACDERAAFP